MGVEHVKRYKCDFCPFEDIPHFDAVGWQELKGHTSPSVQSTAGPKLMCPGCWQACQGAIKTRNEIMEAAARP